MNSWEKSIYPLTGINLEFKRFWYAALHDGVIRVDEKITQIAPISTSEGKQITPSKDMETFSLFIKESYAVRDGRFANNGWLQELPHPVSKVVWDNYAAISPNSAKLLGLESNDLIELSTGEKNKLTIPIFIQPGAADNTITIEAGYGRQIGGTVGTGVGFNANNLLMTYGGLSPWLYSGVMLRVVDGNHKLVTAQTVYAFNEGVTADLPSKRGIIKEGTVQEYLNNPAFLKEDNKHELESVYPFYNYTGVKWGMSVDMNRCLGCGECVIACNVENNIPVVGKEQVDHGREMHWLRIDRYYSGTPEDPNVNNQLMFVLLLQQLTVQTG
jgi:molybdopterin-containing oxidoreductase family iron-sulfur binding subunit